MGSLQFITPGGGGGSGTLTRPITPGIVNADVDPAAGIVKSKLAALGLVDADVAAGAGIAQSKLAALALANLANGTNSLTENANGSLSAVAGAATLGALQASIASQYINGNNVRGYVRFTPSGALTAGQVVAIVNFSSALPSIPFVLVSLVSAASLYGDTVTTSSTTTAGVFSSAPSTAGFSLVCNTAIGAINIGVIYTVFA